MELVLGRSAFPGPAIEAGAAGATFAGEATFDGCVAVTHWPRADVERLLPAELELAANVSPRPDVHPLVCAFGNQTQGSWIWGGFTLPVGLEYFELLIGLPFVKHRRGHHLHTYIPRMYAGNPASVWDGNVRYGLSKQLAEMRWWGSTFVLTTEQGTPLFHAVVETANEGAASAATAPAVRTVAEVFSLPVLGRKETGELVGSYFAWDLDAALIDTAEACLTIDAPLGAGLEPRVFHGTRAGTIVVREMNWKLSWPMRCRF